MALIILDPVSIVHERLSLPDNIVLQVETGYYSSKINHSEVMWGRTVAGVYAWFDLVGASRFELETSCAQGRRATRLRYAPT
jgi:hypothetical protein